MSRWTYVFGEAMTGLARNLLMTVAVILSVAVSLTLFGAALLLSREVSLIADDWLGRIEVAIFLCDGARDCAAITPEQQDELRAQLEDDPVVESVAYESKDEAFERFNEVFANQPELIETISPEALPASFRVKLADPEQFTAVRERFEAFPGVEEIVDQRELLDQVLRVLGGLRIGAFVVALVQMVAGAVLIANTIRVAAFARREQTAVMKLVGASNWYIRLPFLFEGLIEGLVGGALATAALYGSYTVVQPRIDDVVAFLPVIPIGDVWQVGLQITALGAGIAVVASLLSLQRSLDV